MTITRTQPAAHRCRQPQNVNVLARYSTPPPPPTTPGLTARQAGEIARITDRRGRTTWRRRADGTEPGWVPRRPGLLVSSYQEMDAGEAGPGFVVPESAVWGLPARSRSSRGA